MEIVGWSREELEQELGNRFLNLVAPEDQARFLSMGPALVRDGRVDAVCRIRRKDGSLRWVQDSTQEIEQDGETYCQCTLADITEFVHQQNEQDPRIVADAVRKISHASDPLMMLMNDVPDLARIERGKEELREEPVRLWDLGRILYEMFAASMAEAGIRFENEFTVTHGLVQCDAIKLDRIGMNMLRNARKSTPPGGAVWFGVRELDADETAATYRFYVRDTGIGMSREFRQRAFEQFERERTSTESGVTGSGLGLAVIKKMVDRMGGTVTLDSEPGKGTEIAVTVIFALARETGVSDAPCQVRTADLAGLRILLVEDNDFDREIARYVFEGVGFAVEEAVNGADCLDKLTRAGSISC